MLYIIILQMPAQPLYWAQIQKANWRIHNMKKKWKLYVWISYINLFISTFTFGGGYVIIPMVKKIFVTQKKLLQESEFLDLAAIAQSSPGAIAVNLNVLVAKKLAGIPGIALGLIFSILPPLAVSYTHLDSASSLIMDTKILSTML